VGRRLQLTPGGADEPVLTEIVGVMPEEFDHPDPAVQFWIPLRLDPERTWRGGHWFSMIGRLAPGVTFEQADAEMRAMMTNWAEVYPDHHVGHGLFMRPLRDEMVGEARPTLLLLLGTVGFVLLIACANVSSLLLARGESCRRDLTIRSALGAGRGRLLQQQLSESLLLAVSGGAVGLFLAGIAMRALLALEADFASGIDAIGLDERVLAFTAGIVGLTTLIVGMVPAVQAATPDLAAAIKESSRSAVAGAKQIRVRKLIVVTEIALAMLLVVGAGLMVKSFARLVSEDPGFRTENLLFAALNLPGARYTPEQAVDFFRRLREETAALPGVESVTLTARAPLSEDWRNNRFHIEGREAATAGEFCCTGGQVMVGPGFFETMRIPLLRGRLLTADDHRGEAPHVVVIDELMARRFWPGEEAIGTRIRFTQTDGPWHTIVGVVGNVTFDAPGVEFPTLYHSHAQTLSWTGDLEARSGVITIRTTGDPNLSARPFRELVGGLDPQQAIASVATMDEILASSIARPRFIMTLFSVFAGLALALGAVGIYGVISYSVARRTSELGIRQALGATGGTVIRKVLREGATVAGVGMLIGLAAALVATRLLTGFLHEVSATDPWTFGVVAVVVGATALLASYLPARRATKVDPMVALRHE